ncbi:CTP synthase [Candidatus Uhrbacteria bacterium]|nr:CTP synthase [Candidatus Uhrbacteria bacterium]
MKHKFLFVVGGVMSGVGKGTSTAALGLTLRSKGYTVTAIKIDPYVNVDAGTMNPVEHGEVFVTVDGDETDQDIGNYERFLDIDITKINYMTTGRVYLSVIEKERRGGYGGKCVEVVPRVPEEVIARIDRAAKESKADFVLIEIGGTVGEYENILFLEALRMMRLRDPDSVRTILVSYLPVPPSIGEMKTKPTQHAVREINRVGIAPDFIICRSEHALDEPRKEKLSRFCGVPQAHIITAQNARSIYEVPMLFERQQFADTVLKSFHMKAKPSNLAPWEKLVDTLSSVKKEVRIGVIGKYFSTGDFTLSDAYISVLEAIKHAAWANGCKPVIEWLNSEQYEKDPATLKELLQYDGILIPGGFGSRGIEGKIAAIGYARKHKIPYLGLCYGMQCAVIEFARTELGWKDAHTTEIDEKTTHPVIHIMADQTEKLAGQGMGGTLRLGSYPCTLAKGTQSRKAYGAEEISERHRHRYEFNNEFREELERAGLVIAGASPDDRLVEIVEVKDHPFFVGVQFHPEFQSRPLSPHPLFVSFMKAAKTKVKA